MLSVIVIGTILLAGPSLAGLRFEPAKPVSFASGPAGLVAFPALNIAEDTPTWKIVLFWVAVVVNLALFILLFPPELRRRLLKQLIRFALGVLVLLLAMRSRLMKWPEPAIDVAPAAPPEITLPGSTGDIEQFQPPAMAPWMTLVISMILLWLILLGAYFVYRAWRRQQTRRRSTLGAIAEVARGSLAELTAGRNWGDVVMDAYARMNEAVRIARGLQRSESSTPREFAVRLTGTGLPASSVEELTLLFESVRYGGRAPDESARRRAAACLESILQACGMPA